MNHWHRTFLTYTHFVANAIHAAHSEVCSTGIEIVSMTRFHKFALAVGSQISGEASVLRQFSG